MKKQTVLSLVAVLILAANSLAAAQPAQARGLPNPFRIIRALLADTPLGKAAKPFLERRDGYKQADSWFNNKQQDAQTRAQQLNQMFKNGEIDVHTYVKYTANNQLLQKQYAEARSAMKAVTKENFGRQFMQVFVDQVMPVVLKSEAFNEVIKGVNDTLGNAKKVMQDGLKDIANLKEKVIPDSVIRFEDRLKELQDKLDKTGLSGSPVAEIRSKLALVQSEIAQLKEKAKDLATPDLVKQLEKEGQLSVEELGRIQSQLQQELDKVKKNGTIRIPTLSAKNPAVQASLARVAEREARAGQVGDEMKVRKATGEAVEACMVKAGVDRASKDYWRLRTLIEERLVAKGIDNLTPEAITAICLQARDDVVKKATQTTFTQVMIDSNGMQLFNTVNITINSPACTRAWVLGENNGLGVSITINTETGEATGSVSGSALGGEYISAFKGDYVLCKSIGSLAGTGSYDPNLKTWQASGGGELTMDCHYNMFCGYDSESGMEIYGGGDQKLSMPLSFGGQGNDKMSALGFSACGSSAEFTGAVLAGQVLQFTVK
jgi:hypothetical protein